VSDGRKGQALREVLSHKAIIQERLNHGDAARVIWLDLKASNKITVTEANFRNRCKKLGMIDLARDLQRASAVSFSTATHSPQDSSIHALETQSSTSTVSVLPPQQNETVITHDQSDNSETDHTVEPPPGVYVTTRIDPKTGEIIPTSRSTR